jgi:hypothetical protein
MVENDRLDRNPLAAAKKGNPERDRRHVRLFLDVPQLRTLVAATRTLTPRRKPSGPERAMLYTVAANAGYRSDELAALVPACFVLDGPAPSIDLSGVFAKNGKPAFQPVRTDLARQLRDYLSGRPADAGRPGCRWTLTRRTASCPSTSTASAAPTR